MTPAERVRRLVEAGTVAPSEGERLLAAMSAEPPRSRLSAILHPFDRFGGGTAAAIGLLVSVLSVLVGQLGVRFDGFLDLHIPSEPPPLRVSIVEQLIAWILPAICFWAYARALSRRRHVREYPVGYHEAPLRVSRSASRRVPRESRCEVRVVDFVGMVGFARLPLLIGAFPLRYLAPAVAGDPTRLTPATLLLVTIALVFVGANITLLYQGFKNASGLVGPRLVGGFIGLLMVAETLSKLALILLS